MAETTHVNVGGSWEQARESYVNVSGTWRFVTEIWTKVAGVWELVYQSFFASVSPAGAESAVDGTVTNSVTAAGNGGGTPYSFSWAFVSGSGSAVISSPTSAVVSWSVGSPEDSFATWRCTITDAYGRTDTVDVGVTFLTST